MELPKEPTWQLSFKGFVEVSLKLTPRASLQVSPGLSLKLSLDSCLDADRMWPGPKAVLEVSFEVFWRLPHDFP